MNLVAYTLVLVSIFSHAFWNFLTKRATNQDIFLGLSKMAEIVLFALPFALFVFWRGFPWLWWYFFVVGGLLILFYYLSLAQAYRHVDLSVAYPIARSSTLFLPFLAYFFLHEKIDAVGAVAVVLVVVGVIVLQFDEFSRAQLRQFGRQLLRPGIGYAFLTAFIVACYTLWDKAAIQHINPFIYYYGYTLLVTLFYGGLLVWRYPATAVRQEWQTHSREIVAVGFLDMFTYLLVLMALSLSKATYIGAVRQLSLVVAVFLGWRFLGESLRPPKIVGVLLLLMGANLVLFAH